MAVKKESVEVGRPGWQEGKITRVTDLRAQGGKFLIYAVAKSGEKFPGPHFIIELGNQTPIIPSKENFLDWEKSVIEKPKPGVCPRFIKQPPFLNQSIVFERVGEKIIWCPKSVYLKVWFDARKKINKSAVSRKG